MAKGQKRSGREPKKPKMKEKKVDVVTSIFSEGQQANIKKPMKARATSN
ncbi:MAG: hypothetical protein HQL43_08545 [Alphaproteobacteria bacterium]|jgi:hypothetical protein|nr:hypothetical protein [Alphaproteobacteria bacterium]